MLRKMGLGGSVSLTAVRPKAATLPGARAPFQGQPRLPMAPGAARSVLKQPAQKSAMAGIAR